MKSPFLFDPIWRTRRVIRGLRKVALCAFSAEIFALIRLVLSIAFEILIPHNPIHIKLEKGDALLL